MCPKIYIDTLLFSRLHIQDLDFQLPAPPRLGLGGGQLLTIGIHTLRAMKLFTPVSKAAPKAANQRRQGQAAQSDDHLDLLAKLSLSTSQATRRQNPIGHLELKCPAEGPWYKAIWAEHEEYFHLVEKTKAEGHSQTEITKRGAPEVRRFNGALKYYMATTDPEKEEYKIIKDAAVQWSNDLVLEQIPNFTFTKMYKSEWKRLEVGSPVIHLLRMLPSESQLLQDLKSQPVFALKQILGSILATKDHTLQVGKASGAGLERAVQEKFFQKKGPQNNGAKRGASSKLAQASQVAADDRDVRMEAEAADREEAPEPKSPRIKGPD